MKVPSCERTKDRKIKMKMCAKDVQCEPKAKGPGFTDA